MFRLPFKGIDISLLGSQITLGVTSSGPCAFPLFNFKSLYNTASGPAVIKLFGVHFRARVEFLLQISKIGGHQQNLHISSTILCSTRDSDSKQISDSKTEVIKLFEIVFMLELEYETPNFKLAAYLTSKQTQDGTAQIQRQRRRTARCKNGKIIAINN